MGAPATGKSPVLAHQDTRLEALEYAIPDTQYVLATDDAGCIVGLIQAEEAGERLSEDELVSMVFLLIFAGYETTVHLITNGVATLLQHPDQLARLRAQPALIESAIEEILRYNGPIQGTKPGYALEDVTLHGATIPKGAAVIPLLGAANHDPGREAITHQSSPSRVFVVADRLGFHLRPGLIPLGCVDLLGLGKRLLCATGLDVDDILAVGAYLVAVEAGLPRPGSLGLGFWHCHIVPCLWLGVGCALYWTASMRSKWSMRASLLQPSSSRLRAGSGRHSAIVIQ